jgi:hypothetical protein
VKKSIHEIRIPMDIFQHPNGRMKMMMTGDRGDVQLNSDHGGTWNSSHSQSGGKRNTYKDICTRFGWS